MKQPRRFSSPIDPRPPRTHGRWRKAPALLASCVLVLAACGNDDDPTTDTTLSDTPTVETTIAPAGETTIAPAAETTAAPAGETTVAPAVDTTAAGAATGAPEDVIAAIGTQFTGKKITIFSSIRDVEADRLEEGWKPFEDATGIDIEHEPSGEFEQQLRVRADGGNAPDIAIIPQPGLLADLARAGKVIEQPDLAAVVETNNIAGWKDLGTVDGKFYAPPFGANVKSMVWYSPTKFAEKSYAVPTTWAELLTLSDKIVADGGTPWCVGLGSAEATGWPATDWMEDLMLRVNGPDVYDQWYKHEIPFNDPKVKAVADEAAKILLNEKYVKGGVKSLATTTFQDSGLGILDGSCYMHRQASFYGNQFPEGTTKGPDGNVNIFYFPGQTADDRPVLGGGEVLAAFNAKPEVAATLRYLTSAQYANSRAAIGNWLSPSKGLDLNVITDPLEKQFAELLQTASVFRFDASDLMPAAVGAGTFWKEMVNWTQGKETQKVLDDIEASWPK